MRRPFLEITNDLSTEGDENLSADASGAFSTPRSKILPPKKTRVSDAPVDTSQNLSANASDLQPNMTRVDMSIQEGDENLTADVSGAFSPLRFNMAMAGDGTGSSLQFSSGLEMTKEMMDKLEKNSALWDTSVDVSAAFSPSESDLPIPEADKPEPSLFQLNNSQRIEQEKTENLIQDTIPQNRSANTSGVMLTPTRSALMPEAEMESSLLQFSTGLEITKEMMDKLEKNTTPWNASANLSGIFSLLHSDAPLSEENKTESSLLQSDSILETTKEMMEKSEQDVMSETPANLSSVIFTPTCKVPGENEMDSSVKINNDLEINKDIPENSEEDVPQNISVNVSGILSTSGCEASTEENNQVESSVLEPDTSKEVVQNSEQDNILLNNSTNFSNVLSTHKVPMLDMYGMEVSLVESEDEEDKQADQEMKDNLEQDITLSNTSADFSNVLSTSKSDLPIPEADKPESSLFQLNNSQRIEQEKTEDLIQDTIPQNRSANTSGILLTPTRSALMPEAEMESMFQFSSGLEMTKEMIEKLEKSATAWNTSGNVSGGLSLLNPDMIMTEADETESSILKVDDDREMDQGEIREMSVQDIMSVRTPTDFSSMIFTPGKMLEESEMDSMKVNDDMEVSKDVPEKLDQDATLQNTSGNISGILGNSTCKTSMLEKDEIESSFLQLNNGLEISKRMAEILEKGVTALNMSANMSQAIGNQSNIFMTEKDEMNFLLLEARCAHEASKELCERLKKELNDIRNEYNDFKEISEKLEKENLEAKKEIANLNGTILEGKKKFNQMRKEYSEKEQSLNEEIRRKEEKYLEVEIEKDSLISKGKKKLEELGERNEQLSREVEELKQNLKAFEEERQNFLESRFESDNELRETSEKLRNAELRIEELERNMSSVEEEKQKFLENENELREVSEKLKNAELRIEELEKNMDSVEQEKQKLQEIHSNKEEELTKISEQLKDAESRIEEAEKNKNLAEEEKGKLNGLYADLEEQMTTTCEKLGNAEILIEELKLTMEASESEKQKLQEMQQENEEKLKLFESRIEELEKDIRVAEEENRKLKLENEDQKTQLESENQKLHSESENMKTQLESENQKLKAEIENMKVQFESENEKLQSENGNLKTQLESENQKLKAEIENMKVQFESENQKLHLENENLKMQLENENQDLKSENEKQMAEVSGKLKVAELRITSLEKKLKEYEETIDDLEETQRMNSDTIFSLTKQNTQLKEKLGMSGIRAIIEMDASSHSVNEDKEQSFTSAKEYPSPRPQGDTTMTDGKEGTPNTPGRKPSFASKLASPFRKSKQPQNPNSTCNQQ